jgi:hypothetical protein
MKTNPEAIAKFRATTDSMKQYNWAMRTCISCRRRRSAGQFKDKSEICMRCTKGYN